MRQSLKTRLLFAAYKAACALSEAVFNFTERLRVQKEDSYMNDLYDYRDELAEELREGTALLGTLERHLDNVQAELEITHREIYGPDYTPREQVPEGAGVRDFDDLPAPQGVEEDEAPEWYKAVSAGVGCTGCYFDPTHPDGCPGSPGSEVTSCFADQRGDQQEVVFIKR